MSADKCPVCASNRMPDDEFTWYECGRSDSFGRQCPNAERLAIERAKEVERLRAEVDAYRKGGLTEEILRRNEGGILVGRGCRVVLADELQRLHARVAELESGGVVCEVNQQSHPPRQPYVLALLPFGFAENGQKVRVILEANQ